MFSFKNTIHQDTLEYADSRDEKDKKSSGRARAGEQQKVVKDEVSDYLFGTMKDESTHHH